MLQQTQVPRVVPKYHSFLEHFPSAAACAAASVADVVRAWAGLGYNRRAVNLHRAAQHVAAHGWPDDPARAHRAADTLVADGLARLDDGLLTLP